MKPNKDNLIDFRGGWPRGTFVPLSKESLTWGLSPTAVLAYGLLMNRAEFSFRNGWLDKRDLPFVICSMSDLGADLGVSASTARRALGELTDLGLVSRQDIPGRAPRLFLKLLPEEGAEPVENSNPFF